LAGREAVDLDALARSVVEAPGPVIVVASAGTVNTGDTDDLQGIVELRESHPFWLHVDGAFGSFATLDERVAHYLAGLGRADSIAVDLHKWMNVPYDSAVLFTRHRQLQTEVFHNSAGYLSTAGREPEFLHLVPENSRRFRALPVWHSLVAYGRDGLTEVVRRCNDHARRFAAGLETVPGVAVLAPVRLNIVCFDAAVPPQTLTDALARSGKGFLTTTTYLGRPGVRAAFSNWRTTDEDVDLLVDAVATIVSGDSA
jgi:glutamate/tyrosine decarboxylase-like PLP-dependent enzyme